MIVIVKQQWEAIPRSVRIVFWRLLLVVPQMFGVLLVTFFLIRLLPGDPAVLMLGNMATPEAVEQLRNRLGLDGSVWGQFLAYCENIFHGDLGVSIFTSNPVTVDLMERAPATLELIFYSMILTVVIGVALAVIAVRRPGGVADIFSRVYSLVAGAIPDFWIGLILIYVLFTILGWASAPFGRMDVLLTPPPTITGLLTIDALIAGDFQAFWSASGRLVLPVLTLAIVNAGAILKMTQSVFSGVWQSDFVLHARACGLPEHRIMRAALRNSLPPIITMVGFLIGFLLGAAVLVETIFSWGGLGQYAVQAVMNSDYPALQGFILIAAAFILLVYLVVDILYELVDPRIKI